MAEVTVVVNFTKTARAAFNALVGALATHVPDPRLHITVARTHQALDDILIRASTDTYTVVLWSFYSPQFNLARAHLQRIKLHTDSPHIIHLAGGVHASAEPHQTLRAGFDYVAIGEGERIIIDFVRALLADQSPTTVQGVAYLDDEHLRRNGRGELVDLNDFPPFAPQHHLFGAVEITRGCIYACKFCQTPYVSKARFRHRSVENVAHYARIMRAQGFRDFRFISPTALSYGSADERVNLDAIETLLSAVRDAAGPDARIFFGTFPSEVRPEHVTREALRMLKKYVYNDNLIIGGQSGSQRILDTSKRGHTVEAVVDAVRLCIEEGFQPNVDFLFGLPGETPLDAEQTMTLAQTLAQLGAKIHNHTFMPLPGTPFKRAAAGTIDTTTQDAILRLESHGQAYGKWKSQLQTAQELVHIRNEDT